MSLTANRSIAAGDGINRAAGGVTEAVLRWKATPCAGVGWLMFRAGEKLLGCKTVLEAFSTLCLALLLIA